ncbi:flavodoxin [Streptomyces sp. NPDC002838]|uniref:flavodoxin n=1 Tax=Streptomyces sp. NPDC002838 TaxID=3154436 RepID=UPI0033246389
MRSVDAYDTVLLGSPVWNVRAPMIMTTFTEALDFDGKTVIPFTTHAMSGLGTTERDYAASCRGATFGEGLAVRARRSGTPTTRSGPGCAASVCSEADAPIHANVIRPHHGAVRHQRSR